MLQHGLQVKHARLDQHHKNMAFTLPRIQNGKILLRDGKVIDCCCDEQPQESGFIMYCNLPYPCHQEVSWFTINDGNIQVYNDCAFAGNFVPVTPKAGMIVFVKYDRSLGPCLDYHQCDAAVFKLYIKDANSEVFIGDVNLNNASDGGVRIQGPYLVTQAHINALALP